MIQMRAALKSEQMRTSGPRAPDRMSSFEPMMRIAAAASSGVVFADLVADEEEWRGQARGKLSLLERRHVARRHQIPR